MNDGVIGRYLDEASSIVLEMSLEVSVGRDNPLFQGTLQSEVL